MDPVNVYDFEPIARERLPKEHYDFIAGGVEDEITVAENASGFRRIQLLPRVLVDVSSVDTTTQVLGQRIDFPVMVAPVGHQLLAHEEGELASSRAAAAVGTIFSLSTTSTHTIEQVARASGGPKWFQLYMMGGRSVAESFVRRAEASGYVAICLTVDSPRLGHRERDLRNGLEFFLRAKPTNFDEEVLKHVVHNPAVTWDDVEWLRSITSLPILLKGVVRADDARMAVEHGVAGIVVSNHGGRQLDGVPATIECLPDVVEAVDGRAEVLLDGGVRRGTDVFKALALGAKAVLVGRPFLWGLAADGEAGVRRVLGFLRAEFETTMAMMGCRSVSEVHAGLLRRP